MSDRIPKPNYDIKGTVVDVFCGAGGLSHGFVLEGFDVAAGLDVDPSCKYPYEANNPGAFVEKDIAEITGHEIDGFFGQSDVRILAGCAPCQNFSTYSQPNRDRVKGRWALLDKFAELAVESLPDVVTMENVPSLVKDESFSVFIRRLEKAGFHVTWQIVKCAEFGVPQTRKRLVLFASQHGEVTMESSPESPTPTVRSAIGELEPIQAGSCSIADPLHSSSSLTDINMKRIKASLPGGTWKDWPKNLIADCHRVSTGRTYSGVYGRMSWDKPAPTITTQAYGFGNGRFGHPQQHRAISLREAAILQTFPIDYRFVEPGTNVEFTKLGRLIGNAVPVKLARAIAGSVRNHVETVMTTSISSGRVVSN